MRVLGALLVAACSAAALPAATAIAHTTGSFRAAPTVLPALAPATGSVQDVGVGGALPSEATCAARVRPTAENRPANVAFNNTRGVSPNDENPRVTGNFVGTTDEIIQWAACKWGLDVGWARNQAALESFWRQNDTFGDFGTDPSGCLPGHPIGADGVSGQCPQSVGLLQVRYPFHRSAFENNNAIRSTAYNADYAWSIWRRCFNGEYTWLNTVERGRQYAAGDGLGCMGLWFAGRWYTDAAIGYMNRLPTAGGSIPTPPSGLARPSAPRMFAPAVGYGVGSGRVRLTWAAPASNGGAAITDYVVQQSSHGGPWSSLSDGVSTNRSFTVSGLTNGATYSFRVAARNEVGWGPVSNVVMATPRATIPSAPRSLTAAVGTGVGSGRVHLSWAAPSSSGGLTITDYVIQRSWDGGRTWVSLSDGVSASRTYTSTGMANGATYRFRVAARNALGWGPMSNVVAATPRAPTSVVSATAIAVPSTTTVVPTSTTSTTSSSSTSSSSTSSTVASTPPSSDDGVATSIVPTTLPPAAPSEPATTLAPTTEPVVETTTTAAPSTTAPPTTVAVVLPPVQAPDCPAVSGDDAQRIGAAIAGHGLTFAAGTAADDGTTRYVVGSLYDGAGALVAPAATWVVLDGQLLALSDAAVRNSDGLADARSVLIEPNTGLASPVQIELAACAAAAVSGG